MDTRDCRLCPVAPRPAWWPYSGSASGSGHGTSSSGRRPPPSVLPEGSATAQPLGVAGCFPVYWFPLFMGDAIPNPKERKPGLLWECQWQCPSLEVIPLGAGARGPFVSSGRPGDTEVWELLCSVLRAKGEVRGGQAAGKHSTDVGRLVALIPKAPALPGACCSREEWVLSGVWELPQGLPSQASLLLVWVQVCFHPWQPAESPDLY